MPNFPFLKFLTRKDQWCPIINKLLKICNPSVDKVIMLPFGQLSWIMDHKTSVPVIVWKSQAFIFATSKKKYSKLFLTRKKRVYVLFCFKFLLSLWHSRDPHKDSFAICTVSYGPSLSAPYRTAQRVRTFGVDLIGHFKYQSKS